MARTKLTAGRIRDFSCPPDKAQAFLWDSEVPGLAVRATPSGAKAYIFQGKLAGKDIRLTIGPVASWAITNDDARWPGAREQARQFQTLLDRGEDPRQVKAGNLAAAEAKRKDARRADVTMGEAWPAYVEARRPKWGAWHARDHAEAVKAGGAPVTRGRKRDGATTSQPGMIYPLLEMRLADLSAACVQSWLEECNARGQTAAAKSFRLLRGFLNWCSKRPEYEGLVDVDACNSQDVRDKVQGVKAKDDCLQREQLPLWFAHVRQLHNPVHSAYLQALLLTGARREELAGLRWQDVDFQWKALTIRDKVEGERTIPLTPYVAALLAALPRRNEWVFSSPTAASGRLQEPRLGHTKALEAAGLPALTLHGLRRSFGTLAEWVECPAGISAQVMGHKPSAIAEKHYRRRPLDLLRQWHSKIEAWILEQAGIPQPKEGEAGLRVVKAT